MAWRHTWGAPYIVVSSDEDGRLHTLRQMCEACSAQRNPITLVITHWGRHSGCRDRVAPEGRDYSYELERQREALRGMGADGVRVDEYHGRRGGGR